MKHKERIVKDPVIRKNEIIQAAQKLFFSQGYDNTPVNDILQATGIAKGTFYHYFKSKEDLLIEMVSLVTKAAMVQIENIVKLPISPLEKLNRIFQDSQKIKIENPEIMKTTYEALFKEENIKLRIKINETTLNSATPLLAKVIKEGLKSRDFNWVKSNQESDSIAETIMILGMHMGNNQAQLFMNEEQNMIKKFKKIVCHFETSVERLLDLKPGDFHAIEPKIIKLLKNQLLQRTKK